MKKESIYEQLKEMQEAGKWLQDFSRREVIEEMKNEPHDNKHFEYQKNNKSNNKLPF